MNPAFSVVFLTTLSGAAQGLLIALVGVEAAAHLGFLAAPPAALYITGAALSVALGGLGLIASFFHLGHPERAWRAVAMWRTSWLSRECLCLPAFLTRAFFYGIAHWFGSLWSLVFGALGVLASAALFICSAMIYACLRFLQEWATPLTLVNFVLLGCASGFTLANAMSAWFAPALTAGLATCACVLTLPVARASRHRSCVMQDCGRSPRCRARWASRTPRSCRYHAVSRPAHSSCASSFTVNRRARCAGSNGDFLRPRSSRLLC